MDGYFRGSGLWADNKGRYYAHANDYPPPPTIIRPHDRRDSEMEGLPQPQPDRVRWYQYRLRTLLIAFVVLSLPLGLYSRWARRFNETGRLKKQILATVESLEAKCPDTMTQLQWEIAVEYTLHLVGNSLRPVEDDLDELRRFRTEFQAKAEGNVDLSTVLWIWEEFARLTPAGKQYQRFRRHMLEEIERVGAESTRMPVNRRLPRVFDVLVD